MADEIRVHHLEVEPASDQIRVHWLEVEPSADQVQVFWLEVEPGQAQEQAPTWGPGQKRREGPRRREERIARELLARQQHIEAAAISRAVGDSGLVAQHQGPQLLQFERQLAQIEQQLAQEAQAIAQEAIDRANQAARDRDLRLRLLACAALVMTN